MSRCVRSNGKHWYLGGQKWATRAPFLTLHLVTPKDIAAKKEGARYRTPLYHRANFQADWPHRRRDMEPYKP